MANTKSYLARLVARAQPVPPTTAQPAVGPSSGMTATEWEEIVEMAVRPAPPAPDRLPAPAERTSAPDESGDLRPRAVALEPTSREQPQPPSVPRGLEPPAGTLPAAFDRGPMTVPLDAPPEASGTTVDGEPGGIASTSTAPIEIVPAVAIRPPAEDLSHGDPDRAPSTVAVSPPDAVAPQALQIHAPTLEPRADGPDDEPAIDTEERQPSLVIGQLRVEVVAPSARREAQPSSVARPARSGTRTPPPARLDGAAPSVQRFGRA